MFFEKIVIRAHVFQLVPLFYGNNFIVQIVNFRTAHCKQKRRVRRYYKLAFIKPCAVFQKPRKLNLPFGRKAVFRLVKKIQPVLFDFLGEKRKRAFAVGTFAYVFQ